MEQLRIFAIILNSSIVFLFTFLLTGFEIGACRSEEHNNRAKGTGKQVYYFHRYHFHRITVAIKSDFEQYANKK